MAEETIPKCYLKSLENPDSIINITEDIMYVGRNCETKIQDILCSRQQISLKADLKNYVVIVKCLGQNPSSLNGCCLERERIYHAIHNDILDIIHTKLQYKVVFDPPPNLSVTDDEPQLDSKEIALKTPLESTSLASTSNTMQNNGEPMSNKIKLESIDNDNAKKSTINRWEIVGRGQLLIYTTKDVTASSKIASYDLDGTLIKTKSGNVFPKDIHDWQIAFAEVPKKLQTLFNDGYKIVIFTNQLGLSNDQIRRFKPKIENIILKLNVPMQVFIAISEGFYRKPVPGMWNYLCDNKNDGVKVNLDESFYVGDAAGRLENKLMNKKKDFACTDRLMAINIGLPFKTPEEHFMNAKPVPFILPGYNPNILTYPDYLFTPADSTLTTDQFEVIIMVGSPASGKSQFCKMHLESNRYVRVNQDTLHNKNSCIKFAEKQLQQRRNIVIDNTNPTPVSRKIYIDIARHYGANCRCFIMCTSYDQARHNNRFRELIDDSHTKIKDIVFNTYKKAYKEPTASEGFSEILKIYFVPHFTDKSFKKLYKLYLLEK